MHYLVHSYQLKLSFQVLSWLLRRYVLEHKAYVFPSGFYDNALIEQLQVFWAYLGKTAQTCLDTKISAIPDDRGVGGMTVSLDFQVVERRRQNDKACKYLFLKIHSCDLPMM
ncbi:hypothetical protein H8356DRAFT_1332519 [Neocallimastix lanati (nom. inval.)]|nr:hypothetical protein H8356DRAFT_1332519 [Neocallimastix sp. JGI-2020a]